METEKCFTYKNLKTHLEQSLLIFLQNYKKFFAFLVVKRNCLRLENLFFSDESIVVFREIIRNLFFFLVSIRNISLVRRSVL